MKILIIIVIYLLIGAIIGFKDSEKIEAIFNKHDEYNNLSEKMAKASSVIAVVGIILTAPIVELCIVIRKLKYYIFN